MLNKRLESIKNNLEEYTIKNDYKAYEFKDNDVLVFDIEACAINNGSEMLTYSIALMSCTDKTDKMYWFNSVDKFLEMILEQKSKKITIYAHNCLYDIKPFITRFVEIYGNNELITQTYNRTEFNKFSKEKVNVKVMNSRKKKTKPYQYKLIMKDGIFYGLIIYTKYGEIQFRDSFKILPLSLQKCCDAYLNLQLSKDGLDYEKERSLDDELTKEEYSYIYDDVFGLKYLIKSCTIDGFDILGRYFIFNKTTASSQALHNYKSTLIMDYEKSNNAFKDDDFYEYVDNRLQLSNYFNAKSDYEKLDLMFKAIYPTQTYFEDSWVRPSYYGGLCTPHYENVEKYSKYQNKHGVVLDVNSLYPYVMSSRLLPYGKGIHSFNSYESMNDTYKKQFPLYIQEITIGYLEVKPDKMPWLQVKESLYFKPREILTSNKVDGKRVEIKLTLTNVLLELLFDCYEVDAYKLGGHMAFRGSYGLFTNYLEYWSMVKQNSTGALRAISKLLQNSLYGKMGMSCDNEITNFESVDGKFTINHTGETYISSAIYLPLATYITSYAKDYLVKGINNNYDRFLYCDTDSLHLYGILEDVKGLEIDSKKYGCWDNELCFDDFKYLSPKRYAERDIKTGDWVVKCCGLSEKIMKKVDDLDTFTYCEYTSKQLESLSKENKIYSKKDEDDIYYYKDKECTKRIKGLYKSKKSKIVKYGTNILTTPYMITKTNYR